MENKTEKQLQEIRNQLDLIDQEILALLQQRLSVIQPVGEIKKKNNSALFYPIRESQMMIKLKNIYQGNYPDVTVYKIWREIIGTTLNVESKKLYGHNFFVATLNNHGNILTAQEHWGSSVDIIGYDDIESILLELKNKKIEVAMLPYIDENWWQDFSLYNDLSVYEILPIIDNKHAVKQLMVCLKLPETSTGNRYIYLAKINSGNLAEIKKNTQIINVSNEYVLFVVNEKVTENKFGLNHTEITNIGNYNYWQ